jgi:hypothetical protein
MKIQNIDNIHLYTHRYGWYKIINELSNYINSDIILVDFMDKYFNLWFDLPKEIYCEGIKYLFYNKDAYYINTDINKNDVFIYYDNINIYHVIKWYPEYNEFKKVKGILLQNLIKKYNIDIINNEWIGILHYPEFIKEMNYESTESFENLLKSNIFINSISKCKCIITLSNFLKKYISNILKINNINIPINVIYHPTDFNCKLFNYKKFKYNKNKKIIQIGFWMRKMNTIYLINTNKYYKVWLPGGIYWKEMFKKIYPNYNDYLNNKSVNIKMFLNNDEYDDLLTKNICLINVFNSSANNTILECIARNTPILVNNHDAIIEYLGIDYPLYFTSIDDLNRIINSNNFINKILLSYEYLKKMDKSKFTVSYFCNHFKTIINS